MKDLYLLTTGFPYPAKSMETYLETEVKYYDQFRSVTILSMGVRKKQIADKRDIALDNVKVYPIIFGTKLYYICNGISALVDRNFYREIKKLINENRFSWRRLIRLVVYISRSHSDCKKIVKSLGLEEKKRIRNAVLYSYRFEYQPYVMYLLKKYFDHPKMVSRAHRYDLYEERNSDKYIPLRELLLEELDKIYLISDNGREYLINKYPIFKDKLTVSRLGTLDMGEKIPDSSNSVFRIVSCSNIVHVKRVDLIIEVLSQIKNIKIEWIHFGSGEKEEEIKKLATLKLKDNISYLFKGKVSNKTIMDFYKSTNVDLFINLSESEGIPVSIMEALSFGIPCVATDVGGTKEIIKDGYNGFLLSNEYSIDDVVSAISKFYALPIEDKEDYRNKARKYWNEDYNADINYRSFVGELLK